MATVKVSALSALPDASVTASDVVPVVDDLTGTPTTYRLSLGQLRTAVLTAPNAGGWATSDYLAAGAGTIPTTGVLRVGQGTLTTASAPLLNSTATWNDAAVTFTHQLINVTDTASNAASLLADWQVGGSSKWKVTKGGAVTQAGALTVSAGGLTVSAGGMAVTGDSTITGTLSGVTTLTAATLAGTLSTAAQPNITSVGILASPHLTSAVVDSGGLTVSAGTTAVQALTATSGAFSDDVVTAHAQFYQSHRSTGDVLVNLIGVESGTDVAVIGAASLDLRIDAVNTTVTGSGGLAVTTGGLAVTGDSTITGALSGVTTLTATSLVGALTGNATTATALQTARTINGTSFDGTANITVTAAAGTLTGATLNSSVTASSLTSVGVLASPHMTSPVVDSGGLTVTAGNVNASSSRVMSGNLEVWNTWDGANTAGVLKLTSDTAATATAGAAALPAAPVGFLKWRIGSTAVLLPYYNL